jgi:hypothetical protein
VTTQEGVGGERGGVVGGNAQREPLGVAVTGRSPDAVWQSGIDEGERRPARSPLGLAAAGFTRVLGEQGAHVLGSMAFGVGFVLKGEPGTRA